MIRRALATALIAVAATVAGCVTSPPAHAVDPRADDRPCVAERERHGVQFAGRRVIERRWEVTGLGSRVDTMLGRAWAYPRCDIDPADDRYWLYVQWDNQILPELPGMTMFVIYTP